MPDYCSTTMAQVAFMAAKSHGNLDISSVILLDTGCSQHTFCNKTDFKEIRYFQPHETSHGITGIGKTFFQPVGVGTVKIDCSVGGRRHQQAGQPVMKTLYLPTPYTVHPFKQTSYQHPNSLIRTSRYLLRSLDV
jgi:hypothetical protein